MQLQTTSDNACRLDFSAPERGPNEGGAPSRIPSDGRIGSARHEQQQKADAVDDAVRDVLCHRCDDRDEPLRHRNTVEESSTLNAGSGHVKLFVTLHGRKCVFRSSKQAFCGG